MSESATLLKSTGRGSVKTLDTPGWQDLSAAQRIKQGAHLYEKIYWWIVRSFFIYGLICTLFWQFMPPENLPVWVLKPEPPAEPTKLLTMMIVYLPLCFLWEIFQFFPRKSFFRNLPRSLQNISAIFALVTGFFGAFANFYYTVFWWDTVIHFFGGACGVILGYEFCQAISRVRGCAVPRTVALLFAIGFSFFCGTSWECFEFFFDQVFGGDTQHWSLALAQASGTVHPIFQPAKDPASPDWAGRFALIDTMADTVMNVFGTVVAAVGLRLFPYYHRSKVKEP
jgi:hypothetical protein